MDSPVYYTAPNMPDVSEGQIFHGFFTRKNGVSVGDYEGLNCGIGSGDDAGKVQENRRLVSAVAETEPENLLSLYQVHGNECFRVSKNWPLDETRPKADSMVTDRAGFGLGILTADCAPVLFYAEKHNGSPVIGAAHAGWKGALGGVLENTIAAMEELEADQDTIRICVGPCISRVSYEVTSDFFDPFLEEHDESIRFFHPAQKSGHLMFDLSGYCAWRLFRKGLRRIALLDRDTYSNEADFYSYRRMVHRGEKDYGRQISVIAIKK